jgi:hypothetical protein
MPSNDVFVTEVDQAADIETVHPIMNCMIRQDVTQAGTEHKNLGTTN